ncbi:MAG: hypothetical protein ACXVAY_17900 [Mucilaginibacter sp.]
MKIINISRTITNDALLAHLAKNLNRLFSQQRGIDINFRIEQVGDAVEISQPEMYEGVLFSIAINGNELWITRSEHYVDDVNSLTIESILNELFEDLAGNRGAKITQEG